jgi:uncharacterized protein
LKVPPVIATAYSLLIVGCTALVGAFSFWRDGHVYLRHALQFSMASIYSIWLTRAWFVPNIPSMIMGIPKDSFIMILFSLMMLLAAYSMLTFKPNKSIPQNDQTSWLRLISIGSLVGFLSGVVGAGGGFLIIPSLIFIYHFSMKQAIGTSLSIIAINSLSGFSGDLSLGIQMDWFLLGMFILMTFIGVLLGTYLNKRIDGEKLKKIFASFILLLGVFILFQEVFSINIAQ